ncbi:hypothetical protein BCR43DRAFT_488833 [Syncephalastrum racemosum]|uniref:Uncharacterized protein n=1 Tax=Syncephalastrum racemosum TaxID=13706 RepID=A0A1X2HJ86_SYNRA|nr:hypothetical protein BCR43DRAFT_488833 [Syncephalastrum racemosum]
MKALKHKSRKALNLHARRASFIFSFLYFFPFSLFFFFDFFLFSSFFFPSRLYLFHAHHNQFCVSITIMLRNSVLSVQRRYLSNTFARRLNDKAPSSKQEDIHALYNTKEHDADHHKDEQLRSLADHDHHSSGPTQKTPDGFKPSVNAEFDE